MLEPKVVAAAVGGVHGAQRVEQRKLEALSPSCEQDGAKRPPSEKSGEPSIRVDWGGRLETESLGVEGRGCSEIGDIDADPIQSQRCRAVGHGRSAPRTLV